MQIQEYKAPFRHWLVTDFFNWSKDLRRVFEEIPPAEWPHWVRYNNDCERGKRTCREVERIGEFTNGLFAGLNGCNWSDLVGIPNLHPDPTLYGAGIHVTDPGGYLATHLDFALHPANPFDGCAPVERRLNLIMALNPEWREEWGGALELCDDMGTVAKRIYPVFGQAVLWEPSDVAYHGTQRVTDDAPPRVTAAVYYLAPARAGVTRKRAMYFPKRGKSDALPSVQ